MKISVIMPCYLGAYNGAATERPAKLKRAIESFLNQTYAQKELLIVADGCDDTHAFVWKHFSDRSNIFCFKIDKQPLFSGAVRQYALGIAKGDIICYLDSDDFFAQPNHLSHIVNGIKDGSDWVYFDDAIKYSHLPHQSNVVREAKLNRGNIGTSNIAHKNLDGVTWEGCNDYGHDWVFIQRMAAKYPNFKKIEGCSYTVCHIPHSVDT